MNSFIDLFIHLLIYDINSVIYLLHVEKWIEHLTLAQAMECAKAPRRLVMGRMAMRGPIKLWLI